MDTNDTTPNPNPNPTPKRSRRRRWTLAGLAGAGIAALALGACNGGGRWGHGEGHGWHHRGAPASAEDAAKIYTAARLAIDPDTNEEREFLTRLATALRIEPGLVAHLDAQAASVKV